MLACVPLRNCRRPAETGGTGLKKTVALTGSKKEHRGPLLLYPAATRCCKALFVTLTA